MPLSHLEPEVQIKLIELAERWVAAESISNLEQRLQKIDEVYKVLTKTAKEA